MIKDLRKKSYELRKDILKMIHKAGTGHPGGSLSAVDIMTVLYYKEMRVNPSNPGWEDRDRFILSKGHACPALYAILADLGYFSKSELEHLREIGHMLQGHPHRKTTPGVEVNSGSLGQGLSQGIGMAIGARHLNKDFRVYVMMGDGEIEEGQVWEAAMTAGNYKLDNLCAIIDYNKLQGEGPVKDVMNLEPLKQKWEAFSWKVIEIDGHDFVQIANALENAKRIKGKPTMIIADTIKGKGVSFMENVVKWHGSLAPSKEELEIALNELDREVIQNG